MPILTILWQISTIEDAGFSTWPSLAYSPTGQLSVAYSSSNLHLLRVATRNAAGAWDLDTVDINLHSDAAPSLMYRFDQAAVSYVVGLKEIRYALRRGGTPPWTIETVVPMTPNQDHAVGAPSLAMGPSHRPGISFGIAGGGVGYREQPTPSVWTGSTADKKGGSFSALAYSPAGHPAIVYTSKDDQNRDVMKYAAWDGSHWHTETIGPGVGWCTLLFTPTGDPAAVYVDALPTGAVIYGVRTGGTWTLQRVIENANSPSLAFTQAGEPAISCYDSGGSVDYLVLHGGAWQRFVVERAGKDNQGNFVGPFSLTSLGISPTGTPAIAYYDRATGAIRCAIGTLSDIKIQDVTSAVLRDGRSSS